MSWGGDGTQRRMAWEGAQQHGMYIIFSDERERKFGILGVNDIYMQL